MNLFRLDYNEGVTYVDLDSVTGLFVPRITPDKWPRSMAAELFIRGRISKTGIPVYHSHLADLKAALGIDEPTRNADAVK